MSKECVLYNRQCTSCGECDLCDINPARKCNNCGKCLDDAEELRTLYIEDFMTIHTDTELVDEKHKKK